MLYADHYIRKQATSLIIGGLNVICRPLYQATSLIIGGLNVICRPLYQKTSIVHKIVFHYIGVIHMLHKYNCSQITNIDFVDPQAPW